ncbi:lysosomal Pro-X carboxypeptidase [Procambarus clarkii]|uniref:lysosomal Pro-X carboxypeptidase n=1 Tax=Procambarus clarkii TaxID=6728 RepID=UPI001E674B24|nr:lysosomal Pro-X carboxypeptidase-like [Procambarus clarkii]
MLSEIESQWRPSARYFQQFGSGNPALSLSVQCWCSRGKGVGEMLLNALLCTVLLCFCHAYDYDTYFYKQKVDHFSFADPDSFTQRYLINDEFWDSNGGPIFFYAGNEGDITLFVDNTGFMWDIAPEFNAMVVFAEHRYYGVSMPYGNESFSEPKYTGYLTSEQALADYVELITYLKTAISGAEKSPVITFGGSYGGMLAAWFRMKYPHIVQGAIAASAPILQFIDITPCENFGQLVTTDFATESKECAEVIRRSWAAIDSVTSDDAGKTWLTNAWSLCEPLKTQEDIKALKDYLVNVWTNLAMIDYPYPANFLAPLPAFPIKVVCSHLTNPEQVPTALLQELFEGLSVYFNYTGEAKCLDSNQQADVRLDDKGWDFQACTEMVMPFCYDGINDFFEPAPWDFKAFAEDCYNKWGVYPRPFMVAHMYGGKDISAASNIVFSNGLLDPWSTGGVLWNVSDTVVSVIIPEGAHHLDLRGSNPGDPQSVIDARITEKAYIKTWIDDYTYKHNKSKHDKDELHERFQNKIP